jgi:hypothetical protein
MGARRDDGVDRNLLHHLANIYGVGDNFSP